MALKVREAVVAKATVAGLAERIGGRNVFQPPIPKMVILRLFAKCKKRELSIGVSCVIA